MNLRRLTLLAWLAAGCSSPDMTLTPEDVELIRLHYRRFTSSRPDLDPQERAILEGWVPDFFTTLARWEKPGVLRSFDECKTFDDYVETFQRETGSSLESLIQEVFIDWEVSRSREADADLGRESLNSKMDGFLLVCLRDSAAHRDHKLIAQVAADAWNTAVDCLAITRADLAARDRLVVDNGDGQTISTEGRIPLFFTTSRKAGGGRAPPFPLAGRTHAELRLRETREFPRVMGEFDTKIECRILYQNSLCLLVVAHEVAHAAAFLSLSDWSSLKPALELKDKDAFDRAFRNAVPPFLWNEFVHEGIAAAIANRVPSIRKALLIDRLEDHVRLKARTAGVPTSEELTRDPRSMMNALFFDHLIERFGGEKIRKLMQSRAQDFGSACREAFGEELSEIEESWRNSLLK